MENKMMDPVIPMEEMGPGYELPYLMKFMTFEKMTQFSRDLGKSQHSDIEFSKQFGRPTAIAQGLMSHLFLTEVLTRAFGRNWLEGGKITSNFIQSVFIGDTLYVKAKVKEKKAEEGGTRLNLETWCENQRGQVVTVGTASLLVRKS